MKNLTFFMMSITILFSFAFLSCFSYFIWSHAVFDASKTKTDNINFVSWNLSTEEANLSQASDNKDSALTISAQKFNELDKLSSRNNIIINNKTLAELTNYMFSKLPNESVVEIFGEYNKYREYINITGFQSLNTSEATPLLVIFSYSPGIGFIGLIHNHPSKVDEPDFMKSLHCELSETDIDSWNKYKFLDDQIEGIMCNDLGYMILNVPNANLTGFDEYVYKNTQEMKGGNQNGISRS